MTWSPGAAGLLLLGFLGCRSRVPGWDFERMRWQHRADAFETPMLRPPPEGVIPFDTLPASDLPDAATRAMGRSQYGVYCAVCHGAAGYGGTLVASNLPPSSGFSLRTPSTLRLTLREMLDIVARGRGRMPSMAWQLDARGRRAVSWYLMALLRTPGLDSAGRADSAFALQLVAIDSAWREREAERRRAVP